MSREDGADTAVMWSGIIAHTGAAAGPTVPATTATQSQSVNWQVPKGPSGALPASQTDTRPSPALRPSVSFHPPRTL